MSTVARALNMQFAGRFSHSLPKKVFLEASLFVRGASVSYVRWRGISFAAAVPSPTPPPPPDSTPPEVKKTRRRVPKEERRAMVQNFVDKYRALNSGKFPTPSDAKNEVGGSYYTIKRIMQEIEYEWKMTTQNKGGAQIKDTNVEGLEAVEVAGTSNIDEKSLLHGMDSVSTMDCNSELFSRESHLLAEEVQQTSDSHCNKAEVHLKDKITTEDDPEYDNPKLLADTQLSGVDFEDSKIQHIKAELGSEMAAVVDKTILNEMSSASASESDLLTVEAMHILDSRHMETEFNAKQKITAEDELIFDDVKPLSGVNVEDSCDQHIEEELGPQVSIAAECAARESHLLVMETKHLLDSQPQNTEADLNEVTNAEYMQNFDSTNPLDKLHESIRTETSIPIVKTPLVDTGSDSENDSKYATSEIDLQAGETKHALDSHHEKAMYNLNEKKSAQIELNSDGWKHLDEEQNPSEIQKDTRELPNEKETVQHKENPSVWKNLKSFADGIISFWKKL
ncbi:unnamed protein product [Cuscuta campestris]|uniref:AT3G52170-like helix-turn-helix domain-containing protein n=1 Tax=Cuscuta campestris TaxID=132261 RepID=A0A484LRL3_9ASTE|nr:unnamed protein product [Cuscuta campestris]